MIYFKIAETGFAFEVSENIICNDYFGIFKIDSGEYNKLKEKYFCKLTVTDRLPDCGSKLVMSTSSVKAFDVNGEFYYFISRFDNGSFQYLFKESRLRDNDEIIVEKSFLNRLKVASELFEICSFVSVLLEYNTLLLHASFIVRNNGKAVLFSGESGVGKSTQANLWQSTRAAKIINGDRAAIKFENNKWYACGVPFCGSSKICSDGKFELEACIILSQSKETNVAEINKMQKFLFFLSQVSSRKWNVKEYTKTMELIEKFIDNNEIFLLNAENNSSAVEAVERRLRHDK